MTVHLLEVDGDVYEVAHVHTVPWESPEQAVLGRTVDKGLKCYDAEHGDYVWERSPVRRTRAQWEDYFDRLDVVLDEDGQISEAKRLDGLARAS